MNYLTSLTDLAVVKLKKKPQRKSKLAVRRGGSVQCRTSEGNGASALPFFVAALGASAGGLEALGSFFEAMPVDSGIAFVVIQHLAPNHKSMMRELLSRKTRMPVSLAEDGERINPNHVYLIPPKKCLTIFHGKLLLTDWDSKKGPNLPVDAFFSSLAEDQAARAIAIALSGTGSDGTRGIRAIKEAGGLVMIQDERSAKFSGMPHSAIATGLADYILPASDMPGELLKFIHHPFLAQRGRAGLRPAETAIQKITSLIHTQSGIDFSAYKQSTVVRRLQRRMGISKIENAEHYFEYLRQTPEEVRALANDLLINVTRFFRDREAFKCLRDEVIPATFEHASPERSIRVWVPGCATGEEAYSVAMLVAEHAATLDQQYEVKIFATDVNQEAIGFAARGIYPASIAADVSVDLLARYFIREEDGYRICRHVRDLVVFARQNILKDPPFTRMDLISCRNLLIYLQPGCQRKLLSLLFFALGPGGYLFLGTSETVGERQDAFEPVNLKARIFQKRGDAALTIPELAPVSTPIRKALSALVPDDLALGGRPPDKLWNAINAKLIADYAPTCFVVNEKNEILYSFGRPEEFIALQAGRANLNLLKLAPRELSLGLSTAIRQARKQNAAVRHRGVKFQRNLRTRLINLKVEPMSIDHGAAGLLLIFLEESKKPVALRTGENFDSSNASKQHIADLEEDLEHTQESLRVAMQQQATSSEELQATNEELIAANEELQSSNEELESINEELATINSEYQQKNDELVVANNDLNNFLRTSEIGTLFLDESLRIRKFTPVAAEEMNLLPHDAGRLLTDLSHPLIDQLGHKMQQVLRNGTPVEKTVHTRPGVWHLLRISRYRRVGASDQGIVVTFVNVSALKQTQQDLRKKCQNE
jgi:two-component system, chemotaxis family, CheB/CheR fusion protein